MERTQEPVNGWTDKEAVECVYARDLVKCKFWFISFLWELRLCISNKLPGGTDLESYIANKRQTGIRVPSKLRDSTSQFVLYFPSSFLWWCLHSWAHRLYLKRRMLWRPAILDLCSALQSLMLIFMAASSANLVTCRSVCVHGNTHT